jgi:hypothetical protein
VEKAVSVFRAKKDSRGYRTMEILRSIHLRLFNIKHLLNSYAR